MSERIGVPITDLVSPPGKKSAMPLRVIVPNASFGRRTVKMWTSFRLEWISSLWQELQLVASLPPSLAATSVLLDGSGSKLPYRQVKKSETGFAAADSVLPEMHFSAVSAGLSVLSDLFYVCNGGNYAFWCLERYLFGRSAAVALPSLVTRRRGLCARPIPIDSPQAP